MIQDHLVVPAEQGQTNLLVGDKATDHWKKEKNVSFDVLAFLGYLG